MRILNSLRRTMLRKSRFTQYLLYALGEIILVVIGILIALWVNRSNEERKLIDKTQRVGAQVLQQLQKDVKEIDSIRQDWDYDQKVADTILRLTKKDESITITCTACPILITGASIPTITDRIPKSIGDNELHEGELRNLLTEIEFHYLEGLKMTALYEKSIVDFTTTTLKHWMDTYQWFSDYSANGNCDDDCIDYFFASTDYRNRVAYYELNLLNGYYYEVQRFKNRNNKFIAQLEELL